MAEVLKEFEHRIESIALVPSDGGAFEVTVNGTRVYSKLETGRHVEKGELPRLIQALGKDGSR
jgi:selenoprotein W-related protein